MSEKWVDKVTNISKVNGRMVVGKVLVQGIISLISVYALQYGLDHSQIISLIVLLMMLESLGKL